MSELQQSEPEQTALLDLTGKEFNPMWADETTPVFIANNPLHWKAHRLQIMLDRLEKQMQSNPAQFNATVYVRTLDNLTTIMEEINGRAAKPVLEPTTVADGVSESSGSAEVRERITDGVDSGISADNPFAGKRLSPA